MKLKHLLWALAALLVIGLCVWAGFALLGGSTSNEEAGALRAEIAALKAGKISEDPAPPSAPSPPAQPGQPAPGVPVAIPTSFTFNPEPPADRHFAKPAVIPPQGAEASVRLTSEAAAFVELYPVVYASQRPGAILTAEEEVVRQKILTLAKAAGFEAAANSRQGVTLEQYKLDAVGNTRKDRLVYILRSPNIAHLWDTTDPASVAEAKARVARNGGPAHVAVAVAAGAAPVAKALPLGVVRCPSCGATATGIKAGTSVKCKHPGCGATITN